MLHTTPDRRTLLNAATWSVPAVTLAAASPAFATSSISPACILTTTTVGWSSMTAGVPNTLHDAHETGWMRGTTASAGLQVITGHADSFVNTTPYRVTHVNGVLISATAVTSPFTLPANSFISWGNNTSQTASTFITARYSFNVSGETTVVVPNQLLMQFGHHAQTSARQTLVVRVIDGSNAPVVVGKVAAKREMAGAPYPDAGAFLHSKSDAELRRQNYDLIALPETTPRRYLVDWRTTPVTLADTGNRTVVVEYEFELHSLQNQTFTINDDLALSAPQVHEVTC